MDLYLNGRMVRHDTAQISVHDAGLQHAVGLFETMMAYHGEPFRLQSHLDRLVESAQALGLARDLDTKKLSRATLRTIKHNRLQEARIRLTVTAGNLSLLNRDTNKDPACTVLVVATPPTRHDPAYFERGIMVLVAPLKANPWDPLAGHKTLSYWGRLRTIRQAASVGADEAIMLNVSNHLAGGTISNIFLVKDHGLFTPFACGEEAEGALPAPVRPGITRGAIIEIAESLSIPVQRRMLTVNDLLEADEVFLTNSSWHVLPVSRVEKRTIGNGRAGAMTTDLREALLMLIEKETSGQAER